MSANSDNVGEKAIRAGQNAYDHVGAKVVEGAVVGQGGFRLLQGKNYKINYGKLGQVNVLDKAARSAKAAAKNLPAKGDWVFRLDKPHAGYNYNHININQAVSGRPDPHIQIPPGAMNVGRGTAKFCQFMNKANKVLVPVAVAMDTVAVGVSVYEDVKNKTSRNTVKTAASVAGGWGGGFGGAAGGAALGTAIFPGIGTIVGGIVGGLAGGIGGSVAAGQTVEAIGDACDYDIDTVKCKMCGKKFKIRRYRGEKTRPYCDDCEDSSLSSHALQIKTLNPYDFSLM